MGTFADMNASKFTKKNFAVTVQKVNKSYGGNVPALDNISMNVEEGFVYGLLGSSGCGKTTILSCIVGLKKWDSGNITVMGKKVENEGVIASNIGYMPQDVALYEALTVAEMLKYYGSLYHMTNEKFQAQISMLAELLNLPGHGTSCIANLSGGQKRRVSLALTLLHSPKLLILDEPTVGLDPLLRENIWQYLYNLTSSKKTTIIITTHYIEEVKKAHMVGIMRKGTLLVEDNPSALMRSHKTSILEEVVLEICRKDRNNRRKSFEALTKFNMLSPNEITDGLQSVKVSNKDKKLCKWMVCHSGEYDLESEERKANNHNSCTNAVYSEEQESSIKESVTRSLLRTLAYSQVVWINFFRNFIFIFLLLMLPPFQLFSTGMVIGVEPKYTPMGIVNYELPNWETTCQEKKMLAQDHRLNTTCDLKMLSCDLIAQFTSGTYLKAVEYTNADFARLAVTRGEVIGYIEVPENYSAHIIERAVTQRFADNETIDGSTVKLHLDMSDFVTMFVVLTETFRSFQEFVKDAVSACDFDLSIIEVPFFYREPVYGHMNTTARDYVLPALIAGILFEVSFAVTPMVFIHDVKQGTLNRSRVAGLKFSEMVSGIFMTVTSISILQAAICYLSLYYGMGFEILGSIGAYLCLCLTTAFCGGAFGLSVGIMFKDVFMLLLAAIFIIPILMIYAGILRPIEIIPHPYRSLIFHLFPSAGIVEPFRFVMNRGVSLSHPMVWPGILVTLTWGVIFSILCLILLHKMKR